MFRECGLHVTGILTGLGHSSPGSLGAETGLSSVDHRSSEDSARNSRRGAPFEGHLRLLNGRSSLPLGDSLLRFRTRRVKAVGGNEVGAACSGDLNHALTRLEKINRSIVVNRLLCDSALALLGNGDSDVYRLGAARSQRNVSVSRRC